MASEKDDFILSELIELRKDTSNIDKALTEHKVTFETHSAREESYVAELKRMNDSLIEYNLSLREHISRQGVLEDTVVKINSRLTPLEVESIKKQAVKEFWTNGLILVAKILGGLGAFAAIVATISKFSH